MALQGTFSEHTISDLALRFRNRQINLEPGFQRNSVWAPNDRRRLIQSIVSGYPLPSIFFYQRASRGKPVYDVIDGKQRLETIFMFTRLGRFKRGAFDARLDLGDGREREWYGWRDIKRHHPDVRARVEAYKIQTAEVTGDLSEIIDLFVRINSTGKPLTTGERRHAKYYKSPFLEAAENLVHRLQRYFLQQRLLSPGQIARMKGTEFVAELLMSVHQGGSINKKTALDRSIGNEAINRNTLARLAREVRATIKTIRRMVPDLRPTRFHNLVDYYSLFLVVWEMRRDGFVLADRRRNRVAAKMLRQLSNGVDELREALRQARPAKPAQRLYSDYLLTVQGDTDSSANRQRRAELLRGLLGTLFHRKDGKRTFSPEQRRILWNTEEAPRCRSCKKPLTWENFTADHVFAHARGGRTSLKNAQPMCRSCNSRKGAR
jgi:uncharacterized protein DUF262/HNH endonuclease